MDLIDKWEKTGLLAYLNYDNKLKVSQLYESMANYAIKIYPSNWELDGEILINNFYYKKTNFKTCCIFSTGWNLIPAMTGLSEYFSINLS